MSFYAFKGFDENLKCRGFQYEVGKTYSMPEKPETCVKGFHCCTNLSDVFQYYPPWTWAVGWNGFLIPGTHCSPSGNRYCLVEVCGDVDFSYSSKIATNRIKIIQELFLKDVTNISNEN